MIDIKTPDELVAMTEGGKKLGVILQQLLAASKPGISLLAIESQAMDLIAKTGGSPSFVTVPGYRWATCLCVNEVVVHGIPTERKLSEGDVLTIDVGMFYKGLHTDTAWTKIVGRAQGKEQSEKERFLKVGEDALWKAIDQARAGNHVGYISQAIQSTIEKAGYGVVRTLVGHGVGKGIHEEPQIPGLLKGRIEDTPELCSGMTIAIEVIYTMGSPVVVYDNDDGWSIATKDRSLSSVFEHTVAITGGVPIVLTLPS